MMGRLLLMKLPFMCQNLDDVQPIPSFNAPDFRSFVTNDLKILSPSDSISDKQVLILTRKFDPEVTRVSIKLLAKGIDNVCLNVEEIPNQMKVGYHINASRDPQVNFTIGQRNFNNFDFPVVWIRDFDTTLMSFDFLGRDQEMAKRFCYEQWNDSYQILISSLKSEWINRPEANFKAINRLAQLMTAKECGFKIPETLLTNNAKVASEFYRDNNGEVVMKAVHHHSIEIKGKVYYMYTRFLTKDDFLKLRDIVYAPCILQKRLYKKSEIRVTIIDKDIFAAELVCEMIPACQEDIHRYGISRIPKKIVKLDSRTEKACLKIMSKFDLKYCTFDFILDKNDELFFLEINPTGDWYWIEHETKMPITDTMVSYIKRMVNYAEKM